jgi:beta-galactosidase
VVCYSNCDSVELFVNGRSWGVKSYAYAHYGMDRSKSYFDQTNIPPVWPTTADLHLTWDVPYEPGTLRAVGRKDGEIVCECRVATAGAPARIELSVDRAAIAADGRDVAHVTARILDAEGRPVPTANHLLTFAVAGPGRLIGVDNGDPASHEPFAGPRRHAFNGLCLAIVQTTGEAGGLSISAAADGLAPAYVAVTCS